MLYVIFLKQKLVHLTNTLLCSLGITTTLLENDANITCGDIPEKFQIHKRDKPSWYEGFGYDINLTTERVQQKYPGYNLEDIVQLSDYRFTRIIDGLEYAYNNL